MNGQTNCYRCGAATGVDPCWNCGTAQRCTTCRVPLEGPFCTSCGTPAQTSPPTAASVAATVQGHFQDTSGPVPEAPLEVDQSEEGANLIWAWRALRGNTGLLVSVAVMSGLVALLGVGAARAVLGIASDSSSAWLSFFCSTGAALIWVAATSYSYALLFRVWSALVRGSAPAVGWVVRVPRFGTWTLAYFLAIPLSVFPPATAFGIQLLHHVAGDQLSPVEALGQTISTTTRSAKQFFTTVLVSVVIWIYVIATFVGLSALVGFLSGAATVGAVNSWASTNSTNEGEAVFVVVLLIALAVGAVLWFGLTQTIGLWTAARTRRITARPLGQPAA